LLDRRTSARMSLVDPAQPFRRSRKEVALLESVDATDGRLPEQLCKPPNQSTLHHPLPNRQQPCSSTRSHTTAAPISQPATSSELAGGVGLPHRSPAHTSLGMRTPSRLLTHALAKSAIDPAGTEDDEAGYLHVPKILENAGNQNATSEWRVTWMDMEDNATP